MNIFVIILMALFAAGYYLTDAPNANLAGESKEEALESAELKSVLSCVLRAHSEAMMADERAKAVSNSEIPCVERYEIKTRKLCSDDKKIVSSCVPDKIDKSISNYIITTTDIITENGAGKILEVLAQDYPYAANLGIISVGEDKVPYLLLSGGTKREISKAIARETAFKDGELAYITQYKITGRKNPAVISQMAKIKCAYGEIQVYRQNKWTCAPRNIVPVCGGDYIWSADSGSCVPDAGKRPLCQSNQSAVMVDDVWECVGAAPKIECPAGYSAEMNYDGMEWECVAAVGAEEAAVKKCDKVYDRIYGGGTTTLRGNLVSCNDCEKMIVRDDCTAECVPDAAAISKKTCYDGACRNFYFGFPDTRYVANARKNLPELDGAAIPLDDSHSRNRKFNCMECPNGIDEVASLPPYVIICRQ
ncbi:MAG: hypothetical protein LBT45_03715 [Rickettsiales bacterium]|jgi:hypothetical protein|nr:hypothetical protein [Rickettsiales bacterium]